MQKQQPQEPARRLGYRGAIVAPIVMPTQLSEQQCRTPGKQEPAYEKKARTLAASADSPWAVLQSYTPAPSLPALRGAKDHWVRAGEEE